MTPFLRQPAQGLTTNVSRTAGKNPNIRAVAATLGRCIGSKKHPAHMPSVTINIFIQSSCANVSLKIPERKRAKRAAIPSSTLATLSLRWSQKYRSRAPYQVLPGGTDANNCDKQRTWQLSALFLTNLGQQSDLDDGRQRSARYAIKTKQSIDRSEATGLKHIRARAIHKERAWRLKPFFCQQSKV